MAAPVTLMGGSIRRTFRPHTLFAGGHLPEEQLRAAQDVARTDAVTQALLHERAFRACDPDSLLGALLDRGIQERVPRYDRDTSRAYRLNSDIIHKPVAAPGSSPLSVCTKGEPFGYCGPRGRPKPKEEGGDLAKVAWGGAGRPSLREIMSNE